jgi:hypothetical protein
VKSWLGQLTGTQHVMFTPEPAKLIEPDGKSVEAYANECAQLLRTIFRLADIQWESDSKDAESADALRLKADKMNAALSVYADQCQRAEYEILELLFRFRYGPAKWKREYDAAQISIAYPDDFDTTSVEDLLERSTAALSLEMGHTFAAESKKRLVSLLLPDAAPEIVQKINAELDTEPEPLADPRTRLRRSLGAA